MTFHACRTRSTFSRLFWEFDLSLSQPFSIISRLPTVASSSHIKAVAPFKRINLLLESGILGFGIRNAAQGIRNSTNDWNPIPFSPLTLGEKQTIFVLTGPFFVKFRKLLLTTVYEKVDFSVSKTDGSEEQIRVLAMGVERLTFWLLVQIL